MKHLKKFMMKDPAIALSALAHFVKMHKCRGIEERQIANCIPPPTSIADESKWQGNSLKTLPAADVVSAA